MLPGMGWIFFAGLVIAVIGLAIIFGGLGAEKSPESARLKVAAFGVVVLVLGTTTAVLSGGAKWGNWFCSEDVAIPSDLPSKATEAQAKLTGLGITNVEFDGGDKLVVDPNNWSVRWSEPSPGTAVCKKDTVTLVVSR